MNLENVVKEAFVKKLDEVKEELDEDEASGDSEDEEDEEDEELEEESLSQFVQGKETPENPGSGAKVDAAKAPTSVGSRIICDNRDPDTCWFW